MHALFYVLSIFRATARTLGGSLALLSATFASTVICIVPR